MIDAIKELTSTIKDALLKPATNAVYFRAKNNFFGSFIISWICWNWEKIAFLLISNMDIADRIEFVKSHYPNIKDSTWYTFQYSHAVFWPLIMATLFTLTYPVFSLILSIIHKDILFMMEKNSNTAEIRSLRSRRAKIRQNEKNESIKIRQRALDEKIIEHDKELAAISRLKVDDLREKRDTLQNDIDALSMEKSTLDQVLKSQLERKTLLTEEITELNEILSPEKSKKIIIDTLEKKLAETSINLNNSISIIDTQNSQIASSRNELLHLLSSMDSDKRRADQVIKELAKLAGHLRIANYDSLNTEQLGKDIEFDPSLSDEIKSIIKSSSYSAKEVRDSLDSRSSQLKRTLSQLTNNNEKNNQINN